MYIVLDTTLCDKVCQWIAADRWFSPGTCTLVSSTSKTWLPRCNWNIVESGIKHQSCICMYNVILTADSICMCSFGEQMQGRIQDFKLGGGAHLMKIFGVFRVKNHDFTPNNIFFPILGGRPRVRPWNVHLQYYTSMTTCTLYLFCVSLYYYKCTIKFKPHVSLQVHCTYMPTISKNENGITEMLYLKLRHFFLKKKTLTTDNNINTIRQSYSLKLHVLTLSIHVYIVYKCSVFT